jgi:hypothetical protein
LDTLAVQPVRGENRNRNRAMRGRRLKGGSRPGSLANDGSARATLANTGSPRGPFPGGAHRVPEGGDRVAPSAHRGWARRADQQGRGFPRPRQQRARTGAEAVGSSSMDCSGHLPARFDGRALPCLARTAPSSIAKEASVCPCRVSTRGHVPPIDNAGTARDGGRVAEPDPPSSLTTSTFLGYAGGAAWWGPRS